MHIFIYNHMHMVQNAHFFNYIGKKNTFKQENIVMLIQSFNF
jgi:hypothetical protein